MPRRSRFRQVLGPEPKGDVDDEIAFHIEMRVEEYIARGETPERARELAAARFGDLERARTACIVIDTRRTRAMARMDWLREFVADVAYAVRAMRRAPGFAAVAVMTLALGIGATSAVFSVVHAVLIAELPYRDASRLHLVRTVYPDGTPYPLSAPDFMSVQAMTRSFDAVEAYARGLTTLSGQGEPREARTIRVSRGLFDLVGFGAGAGRTFAPEEHQPGRGAVAVLDHGFWMRDLGGDPGVLGRTLQLSGEPHVVVGVLAPGARLSDPADLYLPIAYTEVFSATAERGRRGEFLRVVGRARTDAAAETIAQDLAGIGRQLQQDFPRTNDRLTFGATPVGELVVGATRTPLLVLLGAVGLVLLVACANVASLLLARGAARRGELAVRAALGAGRGRLVRQLLAEAVALSAAGGALGLALAAAAVGLLKWAEPADLPRLDSVAVNGVVVLFALACALLTAILCGVVPALQATGRQAGDFLSASGRGGDQAGGHRLRGLLVVAETTLAVVLLVGAGLLVRSFVELTRVDPGFVPEQAVSFRAMLQGPAFAERESVVRTTDAIVERLRALPGVTTAAAVTELPLTGPGILLTFAVVGAPPPPANVNAEIAVVGVTPDYLRALGATLKRGRGLAESDHAAGAPRVAVINDAGVERWFAGADPIGKRVQIDDEYEVVGVMSDIRQQGLREPVLPQVFVPFAQLPARGVQFVLRGTGEVAALAPAVRRAVAEVNPQVPVSEFARLDRLVSQSVARPRFYTTLLAVFAGVALLLAAVGLFGVLSYAVLQRSREIGVRLALGARASQVTGMVVGSALRLVGFGLALGVAGALAFGRVLQSQLYGVGVADPLTLAGVAAALVATGLLASYLPARRASSLDPGTVLREG